MSRSIQSRGLWPADALTALWLCAGIAAAPAPALAKSAPPAARPNVLVIVGDDLGYNDLGVYGSEIRTPNIDRLAARGTILTNYYSAPLCAPTRAMLLSGTDPHRAGEGLMDMPVEGAPGYEGHLNHRVASLATRLKGAGYHTYMAGKWHLGAKDDQSPTVHGFERSFALLGGAADHFQFKGPGQGQGPGVQYRDDGRLIDSLPEDFYSTVYYTNRMLDYLKSSAADGKPFFAYLAYTAPHWPVQAPPEDIARQRGRYDEGYEVIRQRRFEAWKKLGFGKTDAMMPNLPPGYRPWASLSAEEQARSARRMEVYAAMVERMDAEIGRVLAYLEQSGQLDNTLILFQSDNGAEGVDPTAGRGGGENLDHIGGRGSNDYIGLEWAEAGSAPFFMQKYYAAEGGVHVPAIVSAPKLGVGAGKRSDAVVMTYDVAPTVLELAGVGTAAPKGAKDVLPITGRSYLPLVRGDAAARRGADDLVGWEHNGNAAVRMGDWKLTWIGPDPLGAPSGPARGGPGAAGAPRPSALPPMPGAAPGAPAGFSPPTSRTRADIAKGGPAGAPVGAGGPWKLYNVREDPAELRDLAAQYPDIYQRMLQAWDRYVAENGVIVKQGGSL